MLLFKVCTIVDIESFCYSVESLYTLNALPVLLVKTYTKVGLCLLFLCPKSFSISPYIFLLLYWRSIHTPKGLKSRCGRLISSSLPKRLHDRIKYCTRTLCEAASETSKVYRLCSNVGKMSKRINSYVMCEKVFLNLLSKSPKSSTMINAMWSGAAVVISRSEGWVLGKQKLTSILRIKTFHRL